MDKGIKLFKIEIYGTDKHEKTWMLLVTKNFCNYKWQQSIIFPVNVLWIGFEACIKVWSIHLSDELNMN